MTKLILKVMPSKDRFEIKYKKIAWLCLNQIKYLFIFCKSSLIASKNIIYRNIDNYLEVWIINIKCIESHD